MTIIVHLRVIIMIGVVCDLRYVHTIVEKYFVVLDVVLPMPDYIAVIVYLGKSIIVSVVGYLFYAFPIVQKDFVADSVPPHQTIWPLLFIWGSQSS